MTLASPALFSGAAVLLSGVALVGAILGLGGEGGDPVPAQASAGLHAELDQLEQQGWILSERLSALEGRSAPPGPPAALSGYATEEELAALREELRMALGLRAPLAGRERLDPGSAVFEEQVAEALSALRKQERARGYRAKQEGRLQWIAETMPKIEQWLALTPAQSGEMRAALEMQLQRDAQVLAAWEAGDGGESLGQVKQQNLQTHYQELSVILTPEQLQTYWSRVNGGGK